MSEIKKKMLNKSNAINNGKIPNVTNTVKNIEDDDSIPWDTIDFSSTGQLNNPKDVEVETDIDTDIDNSDDNKTEIPHHNVNIPDNNHSKNMEPKKPNNISSSFKEVDSYDWGSLNDSEFISFVNKISQSKINSTIPLTSEPDDPNKSKITNDETTPIKEPIPPSVDILSSPVLFAQDNNIFSDENDILDDNVANDIEDPDELMQQELQDSDKFAFNSYGEYFQAKHRKQEQQGIELSNFLKQNNSSGNDNDFPPIFKNCKIHVNGRTDPDIIQLRKMIVLYGGKYIHYLSSMGSVTHIIAESLPPRKRIQFKNCKVVNPKWIVESVKNKKLLDWADYRLEQLCNYGQKVINFEKKKRTLEDVEEADEHGQDLEQDIESDQKSNGDDDLLSQELQKAGLTAKDPDFLSIFFSKSRLHRLSTWKSELRSEFLNTAISKLKEKKIKSLKTNPKVILHIDFDCFFATVSAKCSNPPIDINKVPCCVTHGGKSADISSCNYIARKFGVKNGMWMSSALQLCPNIVKLPYQFDEYEKTSKLFYNYLLNLNIDSILPVSIDEALVDISTMCNTGECIEDIVNKIKSDLDNLTHCKLSCGVGKNVLIAKLSLRKAKPNGVHYQPDETLLEFLDNISIKSLPGFGDRLYTKLEDINKPYNQEITIKQLREIDKQKLNATFGIKLGEKLFGYSRGIDTTSIDILSEPEKYLRKSVSIDINWGIRFDLDLEVEAFLKRLAIELNKRLVEIGMLGSLLTLKLSIRHKDAPIEPAKYLGMGYCTFVSKSSKFGISTREIGVISSELKYLWRFLNIEPKELRGVGVSMNKLIKNDDAKVEVDNQMKLQFKKAVPKQYTPIPELKHTSTPVLKNETKSPSKRPVYYEAVTEDIDWEVFDNLPPDLQLEIKQELRRRKLKSSPKKHKSYSNNKNDIVNLVSPKKRTLRCSTPIKINLCSPEKIQEQKNNQLMFQGIHVSDEDEIIRKLINWMDFTFDDDNGVDEMDLNLFNDFMLKLITTNDILRLIRILNNLSFHLKLNNHRLGYRKWKLIIENINLLLSQQSFTNFEFTF